MRLTEEELIIWFNKNSISEKGQAIIRNIRDSEPSRAVRSNGQNVPTDYPSVAMGHMAEAESHKVERPFFSQHDADPDVLEYWEQPPRIYLSYSAKSGRKVRVSVTVDCFVLRKSCAGWEEYKTELDLEDLQKSSPYRYVQNPDGTWWSPPGEEYAKQFGFYFRLRSQKEINWIYFRNLIFLEDYRRYSETVSEEAKLLIYGIVSRTPGITLEALLKQCNGFIDDDVFRLLKEKNLYFDIQNELLTEPEKVHIFNSEGVAQSHNIQSISALYNPSDTKMFTVEIGGRILWGDNIFTIANMDATSVHLLPENQSSSALIRLPSIIFEDLFIKGEIRSTQTTPDKIAIAAITKLRAASDDDMKLANNLFRKIEPLLYGDHMNGISTNIARNIYRYVNKFKEALIIYGNGLLGLLPRIKSKGNRTQRIDDEILNFTSKYIEEEYLTKIKPNRHSVHITYVKKCEELGHTPVSFKRFSVMINEISLEKRTREREGDKAAYQYEQPYEPGHLEPPRHGERPFELAHIDHTELDIELVSSKTGKNFGRPWLTYMEDAFSRRILALSLSFESPSYRSVMRVLRECVKRFHRLPQILTVDGGKEFRSIIFDFFIAHFEITRKLRPPAKPKYGSVLERLFKTTHTEVIYNMEGNTQATKNVRQMTSDVNPKHNAIWTYNDLLARLEQWAYEVYDKMDHWSLGQSPRDAFETGISKTGSRLCRMVRYDEELIMMTRPTTGKGTARVVNGAVKIKNIWYRCPALQNPTVEGTDVPVHYDFDDVGIASVYVDGKWEDCKSEYYDQLVGLTEREKIVITEEIRRKFSNFNQNVQINGQILAEFLQSMKDQQIELKVSQQAREMELKREKQDSGTENDSESSEDDESPDEPKDIQDSDDYEEI